MLFFHKSGQSLHVTEGYTSHVTVIRLFLTVVSDFICQVHL